MVEFIKKYYPVFVLAFALLILLKSCGDSKAIKDIHKENIEIKNEIQAIKDSTYTKTELNIRLRISGLESEKRMIQATDRKMLDVQRQNAIENEIWILEGELDKLKTNSK